MKFHITIQYNTITIMQIIWENWRKYLTLQVNVALLSNGSVKEGMTMLAELYFGSQEENKPWNRLMSGMNTNLHPLWKMKEMKLCRILIFTVIKVRGPDLIIIEKERRQ